MNVHSMQMKMAGSFATFTNEIVIKYKVNVLLYTNTYAQMKGKEEKK